MGGDWGSALWLSGNKDQENGGGGVLCSGCQVERTGRMEGVASVGSSQCAQCSGLGN